MNTRRTTLIVVGYLCLFLYWLVIPLQAQTVNATINGRVSDPQGNAVPGAEITAVNTETGVEYPTKTNGSGIYGFVDLPPGPYRLAVRKEGFKEIDKVGLVLHIQDTVEQNFSLEIGSVSQSITVTGEAPMMNVSSPEDTLAITGREYDSLPLVQADRMRSPGTFAYMAPGVVGAVTAVTGGDYTGVTFTVGIGGSQWYNTEVLVDSIPVGYDTQIGNFVDSAPPVDAIKEFAIITSQLSAEYGHTGAGVVNFTLKSGTNQFHGDVYEFARNTVFDARPYLAATRPVENQNEFGGSAGGPVRLPWYNGRDRTFFFLAYSGSRHAGLSTETQEFIPTAQELQGNFSGDLNSAGNVIPIYDPATTTLNPSGGYTRTQFPGNIVPTSRMDPVALKITPYYPGPNLAGPTNIYEGFTGEAKYNVETITAKMDHSTSSRNKVNGSFTFTNNPRANVSNPLPFPIGYTSVQTTTARTARFSDVWTFKPNMVNDFTAGYDRYRNPDSMYTQGGGWPQKLGITGLPAVGSTFPVFNFTNGYAGLSESYIVNNIDQGTILKDSVSWALGKHLLKFGAETRRYEPNYTTLTNDAGTFNFSNLETDLPGSSATGDGFASFLLGQVDSASLAYPSEIGTRKPYWGFFIQDEFKVAPKVTLTLGLRYEFDEAAYEAHNQSSVMSLTTPNPAAGNIPGALIFAGSGPGRTGARALSNTDYSALGPRFGLAWQLNNKTVVRGGYGIYYSTSYVGLGTAGFTISGSEVSPNNGVSPSFVLQNGFPQNFPTTPSTSPSFSNGQGASFLEPTSGDMPRTQNFTIGIQRELANNVMIEASYIGNHGTRLVANQLVTLNQDNDKDLALGSLLTQSVTSAAAITAGIPIPYSGFTGSVAQALRPFPQYTTLSTQAKAGNNVYNAFQTIVKKRLSMGLSLEASYTLSKNLGYTSSGLSGGSGLDGNIGQDTYNPKNERTILPIDVTHQLQINYTYDLPFGAGRKFLSGTGKLDKFVLGGWGIGAIQTYMSGTPLVISMTNSLPIFNSVLRPNRVSDVPVTTPGVSNGNIIASQTRFINLNAFAAPAPYTFGTAPPEIQDLRNMPVLNENFSFIKVTPITERTSLKFQAGFLNAFNRHRFGSFVTNFSNSTFGEATSTSNPRYIQLAMVLTF